MYKVVEQSLVVAISYILSPGGIDRGVIPSKDLKLLKMSVGQGAFCKFGYAVFIKTIGRTARQLH